MRVVIAVISRNRANGEEEYLLAKPNKDYGEFTGYWYAPGGKIEPGESEEEALVRELKEELNLEIEPLRKIAETPGDVPNQITYWWFCEAKGDMQVNKEELIEAGYFTLKEMDSMDMWPANKKFFQEYIK